MQSFTQLRKRSAILLARWLFFTSSTASVAIAFSSFSVWASEPLPTTSSPTAIEAIQLSSETPAILTQIAPDNTTPEGTLEVESLFQPEPAAESALTF